MLSVGSIVQGSTKEGVSSVGIEKNSAGAKGTDIDISSVNPRRLMRCDDWRSRGNPRSLLSVLVDRRRLGMLDI